MRRMRVRGSMRAFAVRKPIDRPSMAPGQQREQFAPACHIGDQTPARKVTAVVFAQFEPDADWLGRIVLEQHRNTFSINGLRKAR
jgi:hypothetical protein